MPGEIIHQHRRHIFWVPRITLAPISRLFATLFNIEAIRPGSRCRGGRTSATFLEAHTIGRPNSGRQEGVQIRQRCIKNFSIWTFLIFQSMCLVHRSSSIMDLGIKTTCYVMYKYNYKYINFVSVQVIKWNFIVNC